MVDAAGGDPGEAEGQGSLMGDGALRRRAPPDAQRTAGLRILQVSIGFDLPAAAGATGRAGL